MTLPRDQGSGNRTRDSRFVIRKLRHESPITNHGNQSTYNELTDSPYAMRRIVSASSSATESWRILLQALAASLNGIVSVTTSSSSAEASMFLIAGPDST